MLTLRIKLSIVCAFLLGSFCIGNGKMACVGFTKHFSHTNISVNLNQCSLITSQTLSQGSFNVPYASAHLLVYRKVLK